MAKTDIERRNYVNYREFAGIFRVWNAAAKSRRIYVVLQSGEIMER